MKKLKDIYKKGNKVAIKFNKITCIGDEYCVFYPKGAIESRVLKDEFMVRGCDRWLYIVNGAIILIEKMYITNVFPTLATVKPYKDLGQVDFAIEEYKSEDDGLLKIDGEIYEVELWGVRVV